MAYTDADEPQLRQAILQIGRFLHEKSLVAASDGNISVRLPGGRVLCTPTAMSKGLMQDADLVVTDMEGRRLAGTRNPSSEMAMHRLIYQLRPEIHGVVHAHPPTATGFAAAGLPLNQALVEEVVLSLGCVPLAPYGTTGTADLSAALRPLIPHYDAILLANHGVVTFAGDVMGAYFKMETVEHFARISLVAHLLGRQVLLDRNQVERLVEARRRYEGVTTPVPTGADCPVTREAAAGETAPALTSGSGNQWPNGKRRW